MRWRSIIVPPLLVAHVHERLAGIQLQFDNIGKRLDRIERRLDLVETPTAG
jgi:tetrahydromethanopterin S-methyltransferase subunit G